MGFCGECGAEVAQAKFCPSCGFATKNAAPSVATATQKYQENLPKNYSTDGYNGVGGIVDAVRGYANAASEEEKEKKTGQQKWGMFETNYQRTKGITTEQSLQEIEDAMNGKFGSGKGQGNSSNTAGHYTPGGKFGEAGSSSSQQTSTTGYGGLGGGQFGASTAGSSSELAGKGQLGTAKFGTEGNTEGAAFLNQYNKQVNAKYKPGAVGKLL